MDRIASDTFMLWGYCYRPLCCGATVIDLYVVGLLL